PAFAQQGDIRVSVPDKAGEQIIIVPPQQGTYFSGGAQHLMLDGRAELVLANRRKGPGIYHFVFDGIGLYKLYVKPGGSYSLTVSTADRKAPFSATGPDAEAQQQFNQSMREFYQETGMRWYKEDSVFAHNKQRT